MNNRINNMRRSFSSKYAAKKYLNHLSDAQLKQLRYLFFTVTGNGEVSPSRLKGISVEISDRDGFVALHL